jgi:hypothetical protein
MRCYLFAEGDIAAIEELVAADDEAAIDDARALFRAGGERYDGFEVTDGERVVYRYFGNLEEV